MNLYRNLTKAFVFASIVLCFSVQVQAHFVWVYSEDGKVKVVFGEWIEPDQAQFLGGLNKMKAFSLVDGQFKPVEFEKKVDGQEGWFEATQKGLGPSVEVSCPYGVFGRGDKTMFLDYSAKHVTLDYGSAALSSKPSKNLNLNVVPSFVDGKLSLATFFKGVPVSGVEILLESVETSSAELKTDDVGQVLVQPASRYVFRAKHVVEEGGEVDGQKFSEKRYYCTLVLEVPGAEATKAVASDQKGDNKVASAGTISIQKVESGFEDFPRGMTSFGATVVDDCIYVIGGKSGRAHSYAKSYQNRNVYCLKLDGSNNQWTVAGENHGLQGLAIVGHGEKVYRIGGLEARNKEGEDHDLHSVADFLAFDPANKTWTELPKLPEGRSSFDACVAGDHVYVIGGWTMAGEEDSVWATDVLKFDLSKPDSKWESFESTFTTRALTARAHQGQLVVIGGIEESGGTTNTVHICDLKTGEWTVGPDVPTESRMKSFGCSAVTVADELLVSTYDGGIFQLSRDMKSWNKVHQLESGRFFHQMLPISDSRFALVGGSHMEHGSRMEIEVFEVTSAETTKFSKR